MYSFLLPVTFFLKHTHTQIGNDRGTQYRTGVYYHDEEQQKEAEAMFETLQNGPYSGKKIATENKKAMPFWPAEVSKRNDDLLRCWKISTSNVFLFI